MAKQKSITIKGNKEFDFRVYAILSDLPDYQIALALNQKMRWNLHLYLPLIDAESEPPFKFDFFGEQNNAGHFQVALWKNWQNDQFFNPELRGMQNFIRITGEWTNLQEKELMKALKEIFGKANVVNINPSKLKSPDYFMFQISSREQLEDRKIRTALRELNKN